MPSIAIMTAHARFPWLRQIPGGADTMGPWRFTIDRIDPDCAFFVVYDDIAEAIETNLPLERRMLITSEPPGIKSYRAGYFAQFGTVYGPVGAGENWIRTQAALPWFYGVGFEPGGLVANETFDSLMALQPPAKQAAISVVLSKKSQLPKHKARIAFVEAAKARLGERLQVFGRGFSDIGDKAEAIRPFAYHLVLENNDIAHFWTEKTADAYLGWALPIFSGCAELAEYFPEDSFILLDISRTEAAIAQLERILDEAPYASRLPAIAEARMRLMQHFNLFSILAERAESEGYASAFASERGIIRPNRSFAPFAGLKALTKRLGKGLQAVLRPKLP
ncbi:MAG: glycosyltransferase family 10 domain-containing protein [Rhabdaerophilum sp.]